MNRRRWWEELIDPDSKVGPVIWVVLLVLAIGSVLFFGPMLDRLIQGERPSSHLWEPSVGLLARAPGDGLSAVTRPSGDLAPESAGIGR